MKITGLRQYDDLILHDGIAMDAGGDASPDRKQRAFVTPPVRDADGVPIEWPILRIGPNYLTCRGEDGVLDLDADDMRSILDFQQKKGEKIPIESSHFLHLLATEKGLDEAEVLKMIPAGVAAMGYGSVALRGEELCFRAEWTPIAHELLKAKIFKYFSPALRGLVKPPLRLTSVAMENNPAINHLDALAAAADGILNITTKSMTDITKRRSDMTKLQSALGKLLGRDNIALAEGDNPDVAAAVEQKADLIGEFRKSLNLGEDVKDDVILVALKSIVEKAGGVEGLQAKINELAGKVDTMAAAADESKRLALFEQGVREGKITESTKPLWDKLDAKAMADYLPNAPVIAPVGRISRATLVKSDDVALSADEEQIIRKLNITREAYLKERKGE